MMQHQDMQQQQQQQQQLQQQGQAQQQQFLLEDPRDVGSPFVSMPAIPMSVYLADGEAQDLEKVIAI